MLNEKTVEMTNFSLKDYYICYFDILGYKDYMDKNPEEIISINTALWNKIYKKGRRWLFWLKGRYAI